MDIQKINSTKFISYKTNRENLESFKNILDYFCYDYSSNKRVLKEIDNRTRSIKNKYLDGLFGLDRYKRIFLKIPGVYNIDEGFEYYKKIVTCNNFYIMYDDFVNSEKMDVQEYPSYLLMDMLLQHETYTSNKIKIGKTTYKLFKLLKKYNILTDKKIDKINALKLKKSDDYYLCISRNPIDYLFCSTNQSFSSCEDLESDYEQAFYLGLPALNLDPNRFLVFITDGNLLEYETKRELFYHFNYMQRSWGILSDEDKLKLVQWYPACKCDVSPILHKYFKRAVLDRDNNFTSKFSFHLPRFDNNAFAFIYLDNIGMRYDNSGLAYYTPNGRTGWTNENVDYCNGFEEISGISDIMTNEGIGICEFCEETLYEDDYFREVGGYIVCEYCYDNEITTCDNCNTEGVINSNDIYLPNIIEIETDCDCYTLCESCYDKYILECEECGEAIYSKTESYQVVNNTTYCQHCYDKLETCDECEEIITDEPYYINSKVYCSYCQYEIIKREEMI